MNTLKSGYLRITDVENVSVFQRKGKLPELMWMSIYTLDPLYYQGQEVSFTYEENVIQIEFVGLTPSYRIRILKRC